MDVLNFPLFQMHRCRFSMTMVSSRQLPPNRYRMVQALGRTSGTPKKQGTSHAKAKSRPIVGSSWGSPVAESGPVGIPHPTPWSPPCFFFWLLEAQQWTERHALSNGSTSFSTHQVGMWNNMEQLFSHTWRGCTTKPGSSQAFLPGDKFYPNGAASWASLAPSKKNNPTNWIQWECWSAMTMTTVHIINMPIIFIHVRWREAKGWAKEIPTRDAAGFDGLLNLTLGPRPTGATLRVGGPAVSPRTPWSVAENSWQLPLTFW